MSMQTFTPPTQPDQAMARTTEPVGRSIQFGDGYEQNTPYGINPNMEEISPKWTNAKGNEWQYIENFLLANTGQTFLWRPYGRGPQRAYRALSWTLNEKSGGYADITIKLKQMPRV